MHSPAAQHLSPFFSRPFLSACLSVLDKRIPRKREGNTTRITVTAIERKDEEGKREEEIEIHVPVKCLLTTKQRMSRRRRGGSEESVESEPRPQFRQTLESGFSSLLPFDH